MIFKGYLENTLSQLQKLMQPKFREFPGPQKLTHPKNHDFKILGNELMRYLISAKIHLVNVLIFCIAKFNDDTVNVLLIKTKYIKGRHFVATNCSFLIELQLKKETNKFAGNCGRNSVSRPYEYIFVFSFLKTEDF